MFETEELLVLRIKELLKDSWNWENDKNTTSIYEEVNLGYGIADIVVVKHLKETAVGFPLSYSDIVCLNLFEIQRKATAEGIAASTGISLKQIRISLGKLIAGGYLRLRGNEYSLIRKYRKITKKTIAIEVKLKNWQRALKQAKRYRWFADESYVFLDSFAITPALKNIAQFRDSNIGLAGISQGGKIQIHHHPKRERPLNGKMTIMLNELIKKDYFDCKNDLQIPK